MWLRKKWTCGTPAPRQKSQLTKQNKLHHLKCFLCSEILSRESASSSQTSFDCSFLYENLKYQAIHKLAYSAMSLTPTEKVVLKD